MIDGGQQAFKTSRYKTPSKSRSYMWDTWIIRWNQFINLLPDAYDNIKKQLFNKPDLQMGFFSFKEFTTSAVRGTILLEKIFGMQGTCKKDYRYATNICILYFSSSQKAGKVVV